MPKRKNLSFDELALPMRSVGVISKSNRFRNIEPWRGTVRDVTPCREHGNQCEGLMLHIDWPDGARSLICADLLDKIGEGLYQIRR